MQVWQIKTLDAHGEKRGNGTQSTGQLFILDTCEVYCISLRQNRVASTSIYLSFILLYCLLTFQIPQLLKE